MPLNLDTLENLRRRGEMLRGRCPVCAAAGGDRKGEHLMIFSDGRFGCAAHPGDREHRRLIWRLAGDGKAKKPDLAVRPVVLRRACRVSGVVSASVRPPDIGKVKVAGVSDASDANFNPVGGSGKSCMDKDNDLAPSEASGPSPQQSATPMQAGAVKAAVLFTPLDSPFVDGRRYRMAGATELRTKHDVYIEDPNGPWVRNHGVLLAYQP